MMDKNAKIYVAGHRGMVGSAIVRELQRQGYNNIITRTHKELDLCRQENVEKFFAEEKPEYVFLAAAKVGGIVANQEALAEWNSFCRDYDPDGAIVTANDNNELGIPNPYYIPYGCYSWEMVNKLDEIVQKYDLKLLSPDVGCQSYESSVLFSSLGIDGVFHGDVEYLAGYFLPGGNLQYRASVPAGHRPVAI